MIKSEIAKQYDYKATTFFMVAAIALVANSLLNNLFGVIDGNTVVNNITALFICVFEIFAYIMTVKGFIFVNKACKLSEDNENYYMGRNLTVLSILSFIFTVVLGVIAIVFSVMLAQYNQAETLSQTDIQARFNLMIITAIVNIAMQLTAISTPYIIYLWKIQKLADKKYSLNNFALLAMIILIVQLAIGILNSVYVVRGSQSEFLSGFSETLLTVKYLVLMVFFMIRRKSLASADLKNEQSK